MLATQSLVRDELLMPVFCSANFTPSTPPLSQAQSHLVRRASVPVHGSDVDEAGFSVNRASSRHKRGNRGGGWTDWRS
jgi:hypothetical protein